MNEQSVAIVLAEIRGLREQMDFRFDSQDLKITEQGQQLGRPLRADERSHRQWKTRPSLQTGRRREFFSSDQRRSWVRSSVWPGRFSRLWCFDAAICWPCFTKFGH